MTNLGCKGKHERFCFADGNKFHPKACFDLFIFFNFIL